MKCVKTVQSGIKEWMFKLRVRSVILLIFAIVAFGFLLGFTSVYYIIYHKSGTAEAKKSQSLSDSENTINHYDNADSLSFLNPLAHSTVYDYLNFCELGNFHDKIDAYIQKAQQDNDIIKIAVYFRDLNNGLWIGINERERFSLASLNKIPVMIAALKRAEENPPFLQRKLIYKGSAEEDYLNMHPEIDIPKTVLEKNKAYSVEELMKYMIENSDNEATVLLLNELGVNYVLKIKHDLGIREFQEQDAKGTTLSLKSYSTYFRVLYNASYLNVQNSNKALEILSKSDYKQGLRRGIPSNITVCQKYGEKDSMSSETKVQIKQLHEVGIIYYPRKPYLLGIMIKGEDKAKMQKILADISELVYKEVDHQMKTHPKTRIELDMEND